MKRMFWTLLVLGILGWAPLPNLQPFRERIPVLFESAQAITNNPKTYTLQFAAGLTNPVADATTYFMGNFPISALSASAAVVPVWIPKAGVITTAYVSMINFGTLGTTETSTVSVDITNGGANQTLTSAFATNPAAGSFGNTAMSITVAAGNYATIKWITPTYATNPSNVALAGVIRIDVP